MVRKYLIEEEHYTTFLIVLILEASVITIMSSSKVPTSSTDPIFDEHHKELFDLGLRTRKEVVGTEYVENALKRGASEYVIY